MKSQAFCEAGIKDYYEAGRGDISPFFEVGNSSVRVLFLGQSPIYGTFVPAGDFPEPV